MKAFNEQQPGRVPRRVISGICMSLTGAMAWAVVCLVGPYLWADTTSYSRRLLECAVIAVYAVGITSWFVVPIGGLLGFFLPRMLVGLGRWETFWRGAQFGALSGLVVAILLGVGSGRSNGTGWEWFTSLLADAGNKTWLLARTMIPLCAIWVGFWVLSWCLPERQNSTRKH